LFLPPLMVLEARTTAFSSAIFGQFLGNNFSETACFTVVGDCRNWLFRWLVTNTSYWYSVLSAI